MCQAVCAVQVLALTHLVALSQAAFVGNDCVAPAPQHHQENHGGASVHFVGQGTCSAWRSASQAAIVTSTASYNFSQWLRLVDSFGRCCGGVKAIVGGLSYSPLCAA